MTAFDAHHPRYARQVILDGFGICGQGRIQDGHVAVVGLGALGCGAVDLLARAGVGRLTLVDRDVVDWTNLQRQSLYTEADARQGVPKAEAAAARVQSINSSVECVPVTADLTPESAEQVLGLASTDSHSRYPALILDATDSHETRFLLNDVAVKHGVPLLYGGVIGTRGMHATFLPGGPCLRCVFGEPAPPGSIPTCDTAGVLGSAVAMVSAAQTTDAIKLLLGRSGLVAPSLTEFDVWSGARRVVQLGEPDPACPCCRRRQFTFLDSPARDELVSLCGQDAVQVKPASPVKLDLDALAARLVPAGSVQRTRFLLRFHPKGTGGITLSIFEDARAIVHGTTKADIARTVYARFIGM